MMEKEYCADCYCRMLAHDGFEGGVKDADGQPKLMTWEHCDHKDRQMPIALFNICPKEE